MLFETEQEVLAWYEKEERVLTPKFISEIPWHEISQHPLNPEFIPTLLYMRDVEKFTEIYYQELLQTPTVKDPAVRQFIDRWSMEEPVHGELLNRFLNEAGHSTSDTWYEEAKRKIPKSNFIIRPLSTIIARTVGKKFAAVHMTWGAIQEFSTLNGYQRLWEQAKHPVLEYILRAIAREEARHSFFYWSVARIKLLKSNFRQALTRFLVKKFWTPVGQGLKRASETNQVIRALFQGEEGVRFMDQRVNRQLESLPGMAGLKIVTERVAHIALKHTPSSF
ncbi:ferritin-like domain-containing protein [Candidatus Uhrbacteria bacterium]|nr:ferritin-like domain-containing protein [Candidatus Uhrbacteria bacterium]